MAPFIGEIRMMSFDYAPTNWAKCDGAQLSIAQNQALYSLLGTAFGGDGKTFFNLPDLRGRVPVHPGAGINRATKTGEESHTLLNDEMARHQHSIFAAGQAPNNAAADNNALAQVANFYQSASPGTALATEALAPVGSGQAHENRQPYLVVNFCIALQGIFPSRN